MDFSEQNLETIRSIQLHNMTDKEMVDANTKIGENFHYSRGMWWREVKPFFYQPVPFIKPAIPHQNVPNALKSLGGFYHVVPDGSLSNGVIIVNEVKDPRNYEIDLLKGKVRTEIRKALTQVQIYRIDNLDDLLNDGYEVYKSWQNRMQNLLSRKHDPKSYRLWITRVFHHPYVLILGAYFENRLIAFIIAYAIDGIADMSKSFGNTSFQHLGPSTALTYAYIKICKNNSEINKICHGLRSHKASLEQYKVKFGFKHVSYPAYIYLRPLVRPIVRLLLPLQYKRLMGQYSD